MVHDSKLTRRDAIGRVVAGIGAFSVLKESGLDAQQRRGQHQPGTDVADRRDPHARTDVAGLRQQIGQRAAQQGQQDPQLPQSIWYLTDAPWVGFRLIRPLEIPSVEEMYFYWNSSSDKH